ncbi:hypothetical protein ES708_29909 [subsurface metagenome]
MKTFHNSLVCPYFVLKLSAFKPLFQFANMSFKTCSSVNFSLILILDKDLLRRLGSRLLIINFACAGEYSLDIAETMLCNTL